MGHSGLAHAHLIRPVGAARSITNQQNFWTELYINVKAYGKKNIGPLNLIQISGKFLSNQDYFSVAWYLLLGPWLHLVLIQFLLAVRLLLYFPCFSIPLMLQEEEGMICTEPHLSFFTIFMQVTTIRLDWSNVEKYWLILKCGLVQCSSPSHVQMIVRVKSSKLTQTSTISSLGCLSKRTRSMSSLFGFNHSFRNVYPMSCFEGKTALLH